MNDETAYKVVKLILLAFIVLLFTMAYSAWNAYDGRRRLVESQQAACERGKRDRGANALGWRTAQIARLNTVASRLKITYAAAEAQLYKKPKRNDISDLVAARTYEIISDGLEARSKIDCKRVFPKASLIP